MKAVSSKNLYEKYTSPFFEQWRKTHEANKKLSKIKTPGTILIASILLISSVAISIMQNFLLAQINLLGALRFSSARYSLADAKECLKKAVIALLFFPITCLFSPLITAVDLRAPTNPIHPKPFIYAQKFVKILNVHLEAQPLEPESQLFSGRSYSLD